MYAAVCKIQWLFMLEYPELQWKIDFGNSGHQSCAFHVFQEVKLWWTRELTALPTHVIIGSKWSGCRLSERVKCQWWSQTNSHAAACSLRNILVCCLHPPKDSEKDPNRLLPRIQSKTQTSSNTSLGAQGQSQYIRKRYYNIWQSPSFVHSLYRFIHKWLHVYMLKLNDHLCAESFRIHYCSFVPFEDLSVRILSHVNPKTPQPSS